MIEYLRIININFLVNHLKLRFNQSTRAKSNLKTFGVLKD